MKHLLTIAGSDASGGAGIQADLKTFTAHNAYGMSVITSVVAENTSRVISIREVEPQFIMDQLDAVFEDIIVHGVKVGMLFGAGAMQAVAQKLRQYDAPKPVVDPVIAAKDGSALIRKDALDTLIRELIPLSYVLTPNIPEAEEITGIEITNTEDMKKAAYVLKKLGARNVLIKGGHLPGNAEDILFDGKTYTSYTCNRIQTKNTHGTGCTFSSAITANLANGMALSKAVRKAKAFVTASIEHSLPIGKGHGPVHPLYGLNSNKTEV